MGVDIVVRLLVVAVAVLVVVVVARYRPQKPAKPLATAGNLDGPGVFLFTSATCDSCHAAREVYDEVLGPDGYTEHTWEDDAGLLSRLGVEEIPVGTVIDAAGAEVVGFRLIPNRRALARAARRISE